MKIKRLLAILLVLALVITFAGCADQGKESEGPEDPEGNGEAKESYKFAYTTMDLTEPILLALRDNIKDLVEANGDTLLTLDGAYDQNKQVNGIEDFIAQGIDAIFLNPVSRTGIEPALVALHEAGIPIIVVDSGVERDDLISTFVASNNYQAGFNNGEEIKKNFPDGAKIAAINNPNADSVVQRYKGLEDSLKDSNIEIVAVKAISKIDEVMAAAEDIITANPDIDGFWALNDTVGLITLASLESAGMDDVKVFCVDGGPACKQSIVEGGITSVSAQSPVNMAKAAVEAAYKLLKGESVEAEIPVDTIVINADNVNDFDIDGWQ